MGPNRSAVEQLVECPRAQDRARSQDVRHQPCERVCYPHGLVGCGACSSFQSPNEGPDIGHRDSKEPGRHAARRAGDRRWRGATSQEGSRGFLNRQVKASILQPGVNMLQCHPKTALGGKGMAVSGHHLDALGHRTQGATSVFDR